MFPPDCDTRKKSFGKKRSGKSFRPKANTSRDTYRSRQTIPRERRGVGRLHYRSIPLNPRGKKFSDISKLEGNMLIAGAGRAEGEKRNGDRTTTLRRNGSPSPPFPMPVSLYVHPQAGVFRFAIENRVVQTSCTSRGRTAVNAEAPNQFRP